MHFHCNGVAQPRGNEADVRSVRESNIDCWPSDDHLLFFFSNERESLDSGNKDVLKRIVLAESVGESRTHQYTELIN
jgi:hypothetical protein